MTLLERIDRSVFEKLRLAVVAEGKLPEWRALTSVDLDSKKIEYSNLKSSINNPIEVFGNGFYLSRGNKLHNTMVVTRKSLNKGTIGGYKTGYYSTEDQINYSRTQRPVYYTDIEYEIRYFSNKVAELNLMENICFSLFNSSPFLKLLYSDSWQFSNDSYHVANVASLDVSSNTFLEKVHTFTVSNVELGEVKENNNYVLLSTLNYDILDLPTTDSLLEVSLNTGAFNDDFNNDFNQ